MDKAAPPRAATAGRGGFAGAPLTLAAARGPACTGPRAFGEAGFRRSIYGMCARCPGSSLVVFRGGQAARPPPAPGPPRVFNPALCARPPGIRTGRGGPAPARAVERRGPAGPAGPKGGHIRRAPGEGAPPGADRKARRDRRNHTTPTGANRGGAGAPADPPSRNAPSAARDSGRMWRRTPVAPPGPTPPRLPHVGDPPPGAMRPHIPVEPPGGFCACGVVAARGARLPGCTLLARHVRQITSPRAFRVYPRRALLMRRPARLYLPAPPASAAVSSSGPAPYTPGAVTGPFPRSLHAACASGAAGPNLRAVA